MFAAQGVRVVRTPYRSPRANAYAERWVGTVRRECLDWLLIRSASHLEHVLMKFVRHYNAARPHRGLQLGTPVPTRVALQLSLLSASPINNRQIVIDNQVDRLDDLADTDSPLPHLSVEAELKYAADSDIRRVA